MEELHAHQEFLDELSRIDALNAHDRVPYGFDDEPSQFGFLVNNLDTYDEDAHNYQAFQARSAGRLAVVRATLDASGKTK